MQVLQTTTNYWLVLVSVLTSIVACYAAFSLAERMASSRGRAYCFWLSSGAFAMGLGIWSMHYLGMLSVQLPVEVVYHVPTVLLSLLLAVFAAAVALVIVSRAEIRLVHGIGGSVLMGFGIGSMHYVGMHAMRSSAMHHYRPPIVALSILAALGFSWVALWIAFAVRRNSGTRELLKVGAATLMGLGIASMHYTAMAAVTFYRDAMPYSTRNTVHISSIGIVGIALTIGIVLLGSLLSAFFDRQLYQELRQLHAALSEERDRFEAAAECSLDSLFICSAVRDRQGHIEDFVFDYLNRNVERIVATPRGQLVGGRMLELLPLNRSLGLFDRYRQVVESGEAMVCEVFVEGAGITSAWLRIQAVKVRDGVAITASDITAQKQNEQQILHLAHHDPLTGLLNRNLLYDRLGTAVELAKRSNRRVGVFLIDLDTFKQVNDTFGHAAGDGVLITIANRLTSIVRSLDSVVRIGGDEFIVVMPELKALSDGQRVAEKILQAFQQPILVEGQPTCVNCSIGIALYPDSATDVEALLSKADMAMYTAKRLGKNCYRVAGGARQVDQPPRPATPYR